MSCQIHDILSIIMNCFKNKHSKNKKLDKLYFFYNMNTKSRLGSKKKFKYKFKKLKKYRGFFKIKDWKFSKNTLQETETRGYQNIIIKTYKYKYTYRFILSKKKDLNTTKSILDIYSNDPCSNLYWKIDKIKLISKYKNTTNFVGGYPSKNVLNSDLQTCSLNPLTGYYRNGKCDTDENDYGTHTVCAEMTDEFLNFTKERGNDLISSNLENNFPGLKKGNYWCICANRYKEAIDAGIKINVNKNATHIKTKSIIDFN